MEKEKLKNAIDEYIKYFNEIEEIKDYTFSADIIENYEMNNEKCDCILMIIKNDKLNLSGEYYIRLEDFKVNQNILAYVAREAINKTESKIKEWE